MFYGLSSIRRFIIIFKSHPTSSSHLLSAIYPTPSLIFHCIFSQQNAYYLTCTAQCWLAVRLELAGTLIIFFACLSAVLQHLSQAGNEKFAGLAGLSISFALSVTQSLNWTVRMASDLEASFIAVERVNQYTNETTGVPQEASRETTVDADAGSDWPRNGRIVFKGVSLRYRENLPRVLKTIDLVIPPGSKVGVVGRTGSGKVRMALLLNCSLIFVHLRS